METVFDADVDPVEHSLAAPDATAISLTHGTDDARASNGGVGRESVTANQFHYYRLTCDNRIVWGGYDAVYHFGRRVDARCENRPASYRRLAAHFFCQRLHRSGRRRGPVRRDVCLDCSRAGPPRAPSSGWRERPVPFPPEPVASLGIQATRWSLNRADHAAGSATWCCARSTRWGWASIPSRTHSVTPPRSWPMGK